MNYNTQNAKESDKAWLKKCSRLSAIGCPIGVILFVTGFCFTIVQTGFTGERITLGQVGEQAVGSGFTLKKLSLRKLSWSTISFMR